ncbi:MAG: hypothetical protein ACRCZR_06215, partial [Cetobacterium sp.]
LFLKSLCKSLNLNFEKILMVSRRIKKEDFIEFSRKFSKNDIGEHFFIDLLITMRLNETISKEDTDIIFKLSELIFLEKKEMFNLVKISKGILERDLEYITSKKFSFTNYFFPKDSDLIIWNKKITIDSKTNKKQIFADCDIEFIEKEFENYDFKFINCRIKIKDQIILKKSNLEIVGCKLSIEKYLYGTYSAFEIKNSNLELINNEITRKYLGDREVGFLFEIHDSKNISIINNKIHYSKVVFAKNINKFVFAKNEINILYNEYDNFSFEDIEELKFEENRIFPEKSHNLCEINFKDIENLEIIKNNFEINFYNQIYIYNCTYRCKENIYSKDSYETIYADNDSIEIK